MEGAFTHSGEEFLEGSQIEPINAFHSMQYTSLSYVWLMQMYGALQLHAVYICKLHEKPCQYYKSCENLYQVYNLSRSTFQSSNPIICQCNMHNYMHICTIALTTPYINPEPTNQISTLKPTAVLLMVRYYRPCALCVNVQENRKFENHYHHSTKLYTGKQCYTFVAVGIVIVLFPLLGSFRN